MALRISALTGTFMSGVCAIALGPLWSPDMGYVVIGGNAVAGESVSEFRLKLWAEVLRKGSLLGDVDRCDAMPQREVKFCNVVIV